MKLAAHEIYSDVTTELNCRAAYKNLCNEVKRHKCKQFVFRNNFLHYFFRCRREKPSETIFKNEKMERDHGR